MVRPGPPRRVGPVAIVPALLVGLLLAVAGGGRPPFEAPGPGGGRRDVAAAAFDGEAAGMPASVVVRSVPVRTAGTAPPLGVEPATPRPLAVLAALAVVVVAVVMTPGPRRCPVGRGPPGRA